MGFWPGPQIINLKRGNKSRQILHCLYGFWPGPQKMSLNMGILYWNSTVYVHHTQQSTESSFNIWFFFWGKYVCMYVYIQVVSQKYLDWGNITVLALPLLQVGFFPFTVDPFWTICTRPSVSSSARSISGIPVHDAVENHLRCSLNLHIVFESCKFNWIFIFGKRKMLGMSLWLFFVGGRGIILQVLCKLKVRSSFSPWDTDFAAICLIF